MRIPSARAQGRERVRASNTTTNTEVVPSAEEPKVWFQSLETLAQVLSDRNRSLLALIAKTKPASLSELAERSGRANPIYRARSGRWNGTGSFIWKKVRAEKWRRE
jgi:predicted transcriptional regulator